MVDLKTATPLADKIVAALPNLFQPGERFKYNDLAAALEYSAPSVSTALLIVAEGRHVTRVGSGVYEYRRPTEEEYAKRRPIRHTEKPEAILPNEVLTYTVVARPFGKTLVTDGSQLFVVTPVDPANLV